MLLDASALDSLLAFSKSEPMAAYPATPARDSLSTSLLIVHPSKNNYGQLKELRRSQPMTDLELLRKSFAVPESLISQWSLSMGNVVYESQNLRDAIDGFNATVFEAATTYVRLSDPELPGPEYDVPFSDRVALRPKNEEARGAWERLYERFRQKRMEVCSLDLETWTRPELSQGNDGDEAEQVERVEQAEGGHDKEGYIQEKLVGDEHATAEDGPREEGAPSEAVRDAPAGGAVPGGRLAGQEEAVGEL